MIALLTPFGKTRVFRDVVCVFEDFGDITNPHALHTLYRGTTYIDDLGQGARTAAGAAVLLTRTSEEL